MGCGGSKATRTKTAPELVHVEAQSPEQTDTSSTQQRQQPEGNTQNTSEETPQQETQGQKDVKVKDLEGPITQKQIELVQETWKLVNGDLEQVGVEFYIRLFKENPEVLQLFSFRDLENSDEDVMRADDRLKRQGLKTMQHVDLAVSSLNDLGSIVPALKDLGARHTMYKVEEQHYAPIGAALLDTLDKGLGEKFTSEVKKAWTVVYGIVADTMKEGAREALG